MSLALSSEAAGGPPEGGPVLVNKRELAGILSVSLPTLTDWIERFPDFPVWERGANGREYRFDAIAVREWAMARREAEARDEAARRDMLAQFALPLTDPGDAAAGEAVASLEDIRRIREADKLRQERGFLVGVPEIRQALTAAVAKWNRATHATVRQAARDFNLPPAVERALADRFAEAQRQFLRDLTADAEQLAEPSPDARRLA